MMQNNKPAKEEAIKKRRKQAGKSKPGREDGAARVFPVIGALTTEKKERLLYWSIGGFFALVLILMLFSCGPRQGTMMYGVCKIFVERRLQYPDMLDVRFVEQYPMAVRIGYNKIDSFGQHTYHEIECAYRPDPKTGLALDSVWVSYANKRQDLPEEEIDTFNVGIAAIVNNPPDLTLPPHMPREIRALKP
jgi:hypothetical protein